MLAPMTRSIRSQLGELLRSKVAGEDAAAAHGRIWGTPGPRWFTQDDPIWRVHADASMFPGGITALLLQSLHPLSMAGVAGHSGYRGDPWGRLQRTSNYIATTTFGTVEHAEQAIAKVRAVHKHIKGVTADGRAYAASDPHLLRWVHVAEVWSFLAAHRCFGAETLTKAEEDCYVLQCGRSAELLGAERVPTTVLELEAALDEYRGELGSSPEAVDVWVFLLDEPPLSGGARIGYSMLARGARAVLPPWTEELSGRPAPRGGEMVGKMGTSTVRWALGIFDDEADE